MAAASQAIHAEVDHQEAANETWNDQWVDARSKIAFRKARDSASTEYGF
jgi:hypothetical protein